MIIFQSWEMSFLRLMMKVTQDWNHSTVSRVYRERLREGEKKGEQHFLWSKCLVEFGEQTDCFTLRCTEKRFWMLKQPLLLAMNRKLRLQFIGANQNCTTEDSKKVDWSHESQFVLQHLDRRLRIWCKKDESMSSSCLGSMIQVCCCWCNGMEEILCCCWACQCLYDHSVPIFW